LIVSVRTAEQTAAFHGLDDLDVGRIAGDIFEDVGAMTAQARSVESRSCTGCVAALAVDQDTDHLRRGTYQ
jgi:hypothetical protein